jgi:hypothetical protein
LGGRGGLLSFWDPSLWYIFEILLCDIYLRSFLLWNMIPSIGGIDQDIG